MRSNPLYIRIQTYMRKWDWTSESGIFPWFFLMLWMGQANINLRNALIWFETGHNSSQYVMCLTSTNWSSQSAITAFESLIGVVVSPVRYTTYPRKIIYYHIVIKSLSNHYYILMPEIYGNKSLISRLRTCCVITVALSVPSSTGHSYWWK